MANVDGITNAEYSNHPLITRNGIGVRRAVRRHRDGHLPTVTFDDHFDRFARAGPNELRHLVPIPDALSIHADHQVAHLDSRGFGGRAVSDHAYLW